MNKMMINCVLLGYDGNVYQEMMTSSFKPELRLAIRGIPYKEKHLYKTMPGHLIDNEVIVLWEFERKDEDGNYIYVLSTPSEGKK
jgi:hypothetical protein